MHLIRTLTACAVAALLACEAGAQPMPPAPPRPGPAGPGPAAVPPAPADLGTEATVTGRVARWLVNPNGEVDGMLLDDGTQVETPPHLSAALTDAVALKDTVEVAGRRNDAVKVLRATSVRGKRSGRVVDVAPPDPQAPPPPPRPAGALVPMSAGGRIDALLRTGRGDVNGVLLQDGTVVRMAPHAAAQLGGMLRAGATVHARGYGTRNAFGAAFEATAIGADANGMRELYTGPVGPRDAMPPTPPDARDAARAPA